MDEKAPPKIDMTVPHQARVWNYLAGGKDHYDVDRAFAEQLIQAYPGFDAVPRYSRAFLGRAVRHLTAETGIRQFLDIGTGLCPHTTTPTRSRSGPHPTAGSCTSTTTITSLVVHTGRTA